MLVLDLDETLIFATETPLNRSADFPLMRVWLCARSFPLRYHRTKKLEKLKRKGYQLERVIVVDDSPEKHRAAYGNLVRVHPYEGDVDDDELPKLGEYLDSLRTVENIRLVDKRHWHHRLAGNQR